MKRSLPAVLAVLVAVALAANVPGPASAASARGGVIHVVQAVPGTDVDVSVDGKQVRRGVGVKSVLGPYRLAPGKHEVRFRGPSLHVNASVTVKPGANSDVVLHRPAAIDGDPVVNVYRTPTSPIGPGRSRVLLAHTAVVPPADVKVDQKTVFQNIANGEYAKADVPSGTHEVALLPTGQKSKPILGPIDVDLKAWTVTMVYAFGSPSNGSMDVIAHTEALRHDGTVAPKRIKTGSAGLVADADVRPFVTPRDSNENRGVVSLIGGLGLGALVGTAALAGLSRRHRGAHRPG